MLCRWLLQIFSFLSSSSCSCFFPPAERPCRTHQHPPTDLARVLAERWIFCLHVPTKEERNDFAQFAALARPFTHHDGDDLRRLPRGCRSGGSPLLASNAVGEESLRDSSVAEPGALGWVTRLDETTQTCSKVSARAMQLAWCCNGAPVVCTTATPLLLKFSVRPLSQSTANRARQMYSAIRHVGVSSLSRVLRDFTSNPSTEQQRVGQEVGSTPRHFAVG